MELAKGIPLPTIEVARRVRMTPGATSKHLILMHEAGLLDRGFGQLYSIPPRLLVPGENAIDFGAFVVRLDYPDPARK